MMHFFESRELIERLSREHFGADRAAEIVRRSMPAIAWRPADDESESWLYGGAAMIERGADWPAIDGRHLEHAARFKLDGLPKVLADQPETGYLSFFDGYSWLRDAAVEPTRSGHVRYDDGHAVHEVTCPPQLGASAQRDEVMFVDAEGPYWTLPPLPELGQLVSAYEDEDAAERFGDFIEEVEVAIVDNHYFYGQLFGRPTPIQHDITPEPRLDPQQHVSSGMNGWTHLATIRQASTVFDYYYAVDLPGLRSRTFERVVFGAQC